jgi:hypothetical protein
MTRVSLEGREDEDKRKDFKAMQCDLAGFSCGRAEEEQTPPPQSNWNLRCWPESCQATAKPLFPLNSTFSRALSMARIKNARQKNYMRNGQNVLRDYLRGAVKCKLCFLPL